MVFDFNSYMKQRRLDNHEKFTIDKWKSRGLISNDYESIYSIWKNSTNCEKCNHDYSYYRKHMDHCHITGAFRNVLCHRCNMNDMVTNKSGYPNISYAKRQKKWKYDRMTKGIIHQKWFKTKYEAIIYKWLYEAGYSIEF